jgi:hypothetical protein
MIKKTRTVANAFSRVAVTLACSFFVAMVVTSTAQAQWSYEPVVGIGVERDDNATLSTRTDDILDVNGILYDISLRFDYNSALTDFFVTPRIVSRNYSDAPELDTDDKYLESVYRHRTKSSDIRIRVSYDDQTARTAERADTDLDVEDPGDIPDDDSGAVRLKGRRQQLRLRPLWNYQFSGANSMDIDLRYVDTNYDDNLRFDDQGNRLLREFTDTRLAVFFNREFSGRTTGIVTVMGRNYKVEDGFSETKGVGFMGGFERSLSETTNMRALIGLEDTDSNISETDPTFVADIWLRRRLQTVNLLAQYRRSVSASGSGKLAVRDSYNLNLSRKLSEKITAGLGARIYQTNSLDDVLTIDERNYVQLRAEFRWNMTRTLATEVDYRYTYQKRVSLLESANSNQVVLWFFYQPNAIDRRFN